MGLFWTSVPGADGAYAQSSEFLSRHFEYANIEFLAPHDEVKFVVTSRADFDWALRFGEQHGLYERVAQVHMSPSWEHVPPSELANWVVGCGRPVRLNLQLHKYVWGPEVTGV